MTDFLPEDYKEPVTDKPYLNLKDYTQVTFRILGPAITGWEYWNTDNKPVRSRSEFTEMPQDIKTEPGKPPKISFFWIMPVWNYDTEKVQVMEITQKTIRSAILELIDNKKWGDVKGYDLTINKKGKGLETEYSVIPSPHSDLPKEAVEAFKESSINLEAMYEGGNPFAPTGIVAPKKGIAKGNEKRGPMERADYPTEEHNAEDIPF